MRILNFILSLLPISLVYGAGNHPHIEQSFLCEYSPQPMNSELFLQNSKDLIAIPNTFLDGEDVTVEWKNQPNPEKKDFLGISCGDKKEELDFLDKIPVGNITNQGSYVFQGLINMRCNYSIEYFEVENNHTKKTGQTKTSPRNGLDIPMHIHIAFANDPFAMNVMWTSNKKTKPQLKLWSLHELINDNWNWNKLEKTLNGTLKGDYHAKSMCGPPANTINQEYFRHPGYQKLVYISNLEEGNYFYSVGDDEYGWSKKKHFIIGLKQPKATHFIAYGDLGINNLPAGQGTITRISEESNTDFILHFGDISYARGKGWIWERFFRMIEPIASSTPYMVGIGNHEYDHTGQPHKDPSGIQDGGFHPLWGNYGNDSGGECSVPTFYRFQMPNNGNSLYWYSFNQGLVHTIQFSTEHNFTYQSPQYKWLETDLKNVDRMKTPYIVVTGHRPMYTSERPYMGDFIVSKAMQEALEDLFYKYEVDLALWGHYHSYERSCPVYKQVCDSKGITHIVVGTAGAEIEKGTFGGKGFEWSKANAQDFGYLSVDTDIDEMHVKFIRNNDGMIGDEAFLPSRKFVKLNLAVAI